MSVAHFDRALKWLLAVETTQNGSHQRINVTDGGKASETNEVAGHIGGAFNLIMPESVHAPAIVWCRRSLVSISFLETQCTWDDWFTSASSGRIDSQSLFKVQDEGARWQMKYLLSLPQSLNNTCVYSAWGLQVVGTNCNVPTEKNALLSISECRVSWTCCCRLIWKIDLTFREFWYRVSVLFYLSNHTWIAWSMSHFTNKQTEKHPNKQQKTVDIKLREDCSKFYHFMDHRLTTNCISIV